MSNEIIKKPTENCQNIKLQILKPLLNGLKILRIEEAEINERCKGLTMLLENKVGNNVRLFIEPSKETTDLIISVYNPI